MQLLHAGESQFTYSQKGNYELLYNQGFIAQLTHHLCVGGGRGLSIVMFVTYRN